MDNSQYHAKTTKARCDAIFSELDDEYTHWEPLFKEIAKFINPYQQRFNLGRRNNKENAINTAIIDPHGSDSLNVAAGGMFFWYHEPNNKMDSF
ncbi:portal protein [Vibrio harveyi]|uniref:portal protein n=1 Tax=Vibrio harveyi TaxID=669 RepID=UPI00217CC8EC|nr:portal protein [Vibrio harveyi]